MADSPKHTHFATTNAVFSSQTRQTRTALVASSVALFLLSTIGEISETIKIPPGYFEIPPIYVPVILFISTVYFIVSYYISYNYDANNEALERRALQRMQAIAGEYHKVKQTHTEFVRAMNKYDKIITGEISEGLNSIDHFNFGHMVHQLEDEEKKSVLMPVLNFVNSFEKHDFAKIRSNDLGLMLRVGQTTEAFSLRLEDEIGNMTQNLNGISRQKNYWLDYIFPLSLGSISVILSIIVWVWGIVR